MSQKNQSELDTALAALLPPGFCDVLGFLIPADRISEELVRWYEEDHSLRAKFQWPHMKRYQRNYIWQTFRGLPPLYKVITEFSWKSQGDMAAVRALYHSDAARETLTEILPSFVITPFPRDSYYLVPVEEQVIRADLSPAALDKPRHRRIALLRCGVDETVASFETAALDYAERAATIWTDCGIKIFLRRMAGEIPAPADAFLFIDGQLSGPLSASLPDAVDVVAEFGTTSFRSPLSEP